MVKVSGSRMATPFGPPRPGRTPTMTPRIRPIAIMPRLYHEKMTTKPWNRLNTSSTWQSSYMVTPYNSVSEQGFQRSLG